MEIKSTLTNATGDMLNVVYQDVDSELDIKDKKISAVHAFCFYNDQLVIVYTGSKGIWTPPGGGVEVGEDAKDAVQREVQEESNMRVLKQRFIGCQHITGSTGIISQTRSVCLVEPYGEFVIDPDGDITEIKLIDPNEYKKYFNWGVIGDRLMQRALEIKAEMQLELD